MLNKCESLSVKNYILTSCTAAINHCVQRKNKFTLIDKNFEFLRNAIRNFDSLLRR